MALQWMDNFTVYGSTATNMANGPYADVAGCSIQDDPEASITQNVVRMSTTTNGMSELRRVLTGPQTTVGVAVRCWQSILPVELGTGFRIYFRDINNLSHMYLTCNPSGYLLLYRIDDNPLSSNSTTTLVAQSATAVIVANAWQHIEIKWTASSSSGTVQVRVEGTQVINASGIRTVSDEAAAAPTCHNVVLAHTNSGNTNLTYWKDYVIWDGTGSINNNFIGLVQVYKIIPDGDTTLGWTPNSGSTGYTQIDDNPTPDDNTTYISAGSSLPGHSQFTLTDLPVDVTAVKGVMSIVRSKKTDGGDGTLQTALVSGGSVGNGTDRSVTTAYTYWTDMYDQDPAGGNWTKAAVDALQLRLNRTS